MLSCGLSPYVVIKDTALKIIHCNAAFLKDYSFNHQAIKGKSMADLIDSPYNHLDISYDLSILQGKSYYTILPYHDNAGKRCFFNKHSVLYHDNLGDIVGLKSIFYPLTINSVQDLLKDIRYLNKAYQCDYINIGQDGLFNHLSKDESEVLFYLIRGTLLSDITKKLTLASKRLTELRDLIYYKTGANNTAELLMYATRNNLLCNVPVSCVQKPLFDQHKSIPSTAQQPLAQTIKAIAKPILVDGIDYFAYLKYFPDNTEIIASTHNAQENIFHSHEVYQAYSTLKRIERTDSPSFLPASHPHSFNVVNLNPQHKRARNTWPKRVWVLIYYLKGAIELFCFGSIQTLFETNYYEKKHHQFVHFCLYFLGQARPHLLAINKQKSANHRIQSKEDTMAIQCPDARVKSKLSPLPLSKRELAVLAKIARAVPSKIIGMHLGVSEKTVNEYVRRLRVKLKCHTTYELTQIYWRQSVNN